ncbi:MAG: 4-alpha-glucanotransferase [Clostridiales bacterium]|nr:4-alpha-glucanotransferase [Clostridiales bacterium]
MEIKRLSGILAHPTSFPSKYGIGDLGEGARIFMRFLKDSGQKLWQILPLNPTGFGDSPYQSFSTFASNELLISPDGLFEDNLLEEIDLIPFTPCNPATVDYGPVIKHKHTIHRKAYARFKTQLNETGEDSELAAGYKAFCRKHASWLPDYALFVAIKNYFIDERRNEFLSPGYKAYKRANPLLSGENQVKDFYYGAVWNSWPEDLAQAKPAAVKAWRAKLADEVQYIQFLQFMFMKQWAKIKSLAAQYGITVIGDIPIFVAYDSADMWTNRALFQMNGMNPAAVAGVPPDYFSQKGQLWGNPLYEWDEHQRTGFKWWKRRLAHTLELVDVVRIDHFRGFEAYWRINYGAKDAVKGKWVKAPGDALFESLGPANIIAEDLGVITKEVTAMRRRFGLPGMRILQFAMEGGAADPYMPHNFEDGHSVVYTGTHDNETTMGWYSGASEKTKDYFRKYLNVSGENAAWDLMRLAFSSTAGWAVVPIQDVLSLGNEARMNLPGSKEGNWRFRFTADMLTDERAKGLRYLSELFGRNLDISK